MKQHHKIFIFILTSFISFNSFGDYRNNHRDSRSRGRIESLRSTAYKALKESSEAIFDNLDYLNKGDLIQIIEMSKTLETIAYSDSTNNNDNYRDHGQRRGTPRSRRNNRGNHQPNRFPLLNFSAQIESTSIFIEASTTQDIFNTCLQNVTLIQNVDHISVQVVGGSSASVNTGGYIHNSRNAICGTVTSLAIEASFKSNQPITTSPYVLYGIAENFAFYGEGNSLGEVIQSCLANDTVPTTFQVDEIKATLNRGVTQQQTTGSYWRTKQDICSIGLQIATARN